MAIAIENLNTKFTKHKILSICSRIDPMVHPVPDTPPMYGEQRDGEYNLIYSFAAGQTLGGSLFCREGNGACIVYFPEASLVCLKYFDLPGSAIMEFYYIRNSDYDAVSITEYLARNKYLFFVCNLVDEYLG